MLDPPITAEMRKYGSLLIECSRNILQDYESMQFNLLCFQSNVSNFLLCEYTGISSYT